MTEQDIKIVEVLLREYRVNKAVISGEPSPQITPEEIIKLKQRNKEIGKELAEKYREYFNEKPTEWEEIQPSLEYMENGLLG